MSETSIVQKVQSEIQTELANKETAAALLSTTFKGLTPQLMFQALREGMIRGFTFREFLQRDVYALPFNTKNGPTYSIVTSIDFARKIASRTGQYIGKSEPIFEIDEETGAILSCKITVKRLVSGHVGEFTELVYFAEYDGKRNLWLSKPKTMIAKVAEMHALRMAFPEEMAKLYVEEEFDKPSRISEVVENQTTSNLTMGNHYAEEINTTEDGTGEAPDAETIIQIEEETNK